MWKTCTAFGSHKIIAIIAKTNQTESEILKLRGEIVDNGKLKPPPMPAVKCIVALYIPVATPICVGKYHLTKLGNKTLPKAIPMPKSTVPNKKC